MGLYIAGWVCRRLQKPKQWQSLNRTLTWEGIVTGGVEVCVSQIEGVFMSLGICRLTKVKRENLMLTICVPANFGLFRRGTIWEPFRSRHCPPAPGLSHRLTQLFTRVSQIS